MNLERKVEIVDSQISFGECLLSDSSEMWIPRASENASEIAITRIPPIITRVEWVLEYKPTIKPSVVIIPEVKPKLKPFFNESLISLFYPARSPRPSGVPRPSLTGFTPFSNGVYLFFYPPVMRVDIHSFSSYKPY